MSRSPLFTLVLPIILAAGFSAAAAPSHAAELSSISGHVADPSGQAVAGAIVSLRSPSGLVRSTQTARDGGFEFENVPPGVYEVLVAADGFHADPVRLTADAGRTSTIAFTLRLAALTDTVVVSGSFVEMPRAEVTSEVFSLTRKDIDARQFATVADALRLVPGMSVATTGGLGSVTSLFPRGGESDYTLVLVDGIKLNSVGGGFDFGHLTTFGLSQVEVVRGAQSAVFGSDAIGGVVHLRTAIGGRPSARGVFEGGSYGTARFAAGTTGSYGPLDWGLNVDRSAADGWTDAAPGSAERVTNDDYEASQLSLAANWRASRRSTLRMDARFATNDRGYPGPFGSNPIGAYGGIDRVSRGRNDTGAGSVVFTHEWDPKTAIRLQSTYADLRSDFTSAYGNSESRSRRLTAQGQVDRAFADALGFTAGAAFDAERADSTYITGALAQQMPVERRTAAAFGEVRWRSAARLFVTAGVRVSSITRDALEADPLAWTPRPALPEDNVLSANPRAAVSYYLRTSDATGGNWSRLHASAGTGIRPPDAFEIAYTDNPALKPERSRSLDAGFEQALAGGLAVVDATMFFNDYDDLIVAVGRSLQDYSRYRTDNISNARARGLDASATIRTRWGLEARLAYTFLDTAVLAVDSADGVAPPPFTPGDWLVRRPRHQASVDVLWTHRRVTAFGRAGGRSRVLDVEPNWGASGGLFHSTGFAVADLGASVHVTSSVDITARIENLLDRRYETVLGYPAPRRAFSVGVRVAAGR